MLLEAQHLIAIHRLDPEAWATLAAEYADWVEHTAFDFEFCDVLVDRLEAIIGLASPRQRIAAILATAHLAESHNRWFVMRRVLNLCGRDMDPTIAKRISMEIRLDDFRNREFRACAERVSDSIERYHPEIRDALRDGGRS